ncbi:hypothetical protein RchiOBHm_Chr4g0445101 [Rosa chinensis]|uniref:Uncharacterized protein n=1 Tax=Rosa chinensis TaxID=74649 RepID=A0A2P6R4A3_ROSCH|nr:hypothetical protein RchiOBHm_Chr4g0445101 [Rosa chinensis]
MFSCVWHKRIRAGMVKYKNQIRCQLLLYHHQYKDANSPPLLYPNLNLTQGLHSQPLLYLTLLQATAKASFFKPNNPTELSLRGQSHDVAALRSSFVLDSSVKCRQIEVEFSAANGLAQWKRETERDVELLPLSPETERLSVGCVGSIRSH